MHSLDTSVKILKAALSDNLDNDSFYDLDLPQGPHSIRQFIEFMTAGNVIVRSIGEAGLAQFPDLTNLNMSFADFLATTVRVGDGGDVHIGTFASGHFSDNLVFALARKVVREGLHEPGDEAALNEVAADSWQGWVRAMALPKNVEAIGGALFDHIFKTLKDRTLLSFFVKPTAPGEFRAWGPSASSGAGRKLPTRVVQGDGHTVTVTVSRYDDEGEVDRVTAYEWLATLCKDGADEPDAAACGMVYVFERENGKPLGNLNHLMVAADIMSDEDTLQAKAFIQQHKDARRVIETSDLCFVWIWERRGGADKGLGASCLTAGLNDLRRRFKKMRTVVFDVRPVQFVDWAAQVDPPMVAVEKQTAIENLISYIERLNLGLDVRPIINCSANHFHDALVAVGQASLGGFDDGSDDDDDDLDEGEHINVEEFSDEIAVLFRRAGLDELADKVNNGDAPYEEITAALKHMVFDPHVHYLRVSGTGSTGMFGEAPEPIEIEEAVDMSEDFAEFLDSLPDHIVVDNAFTLGDDCLICEVRSETPFGTLSELYTLVPKPRPVNLDQVYQYLNL